MKISVEVADESAEYVRQMMDYMMVRAGTDTVATMTLTLYAQYSAPSAFIFRVLSVDP